MMPERNKYASVDRLAALLSLLSIDDWEEMHAIIPQLDYPANDESAQRAFRRDIAALEALGFEIEKTSGRRNPAYRLMGHKKWPRASAYERAVRVGMPRNVRQG